MRLSRQCGERLTRTGPPHKRRSAAESGMSCAYRPFITGSYADPHNTPPCMGHNPSSGLRTPPGPSVEDMNIHHRCLDVTVKPG